MKSAFLSSAAQTLRRLFGYQNTNNRVLDILKGCLAQPMYEKILEQINNGSDPEQLRTNLDIITAGNSDLSPEEKSTLEAYKLTLS